MRSISFLFFILLTSTGISAEPEPAKPIEPPKGTQTYRDLEYVPGGHERQKLDLFLPEKGDNFPLVIWIHGGAWRGGDKGTCSFLGLTTKGFAVASLNYRYSRQAVFPAQIQDCKSAVRWLREHSAEYHLNPAKIGVVGHSAGGHLAALLGTTGGQEEYGSVSTTSSKVQAVVDFSGPVDLASMPPAGEKPMIPMLLGGPVEQNMEKVRLANPSLFATPDDPPFLLIHGAKDETVPPEQAGLLEAALKKAGVPVTVQIFPDLEHGTLNYKTRALTEAFFKEHLK